MARRQSRIVTGLAGLLAVSGVNGLLNDPGNSLLGSAYAQDDESWDEEANADETDESSAQGSDEAGDGESAPESASTGDGSGTQEEAAPAEPAETAEDPVATTGSGEAAAEAVAETPAEPGPAPEAVANTQDAPQAAEGSEPQDASGTDNGGSSEEQKIRALLESVDPTGANSIGNSDLISSTQINSVHALAFIKYVEEEFNIELTAEEINLKFNTIESIGALVRSKRP